MVRMRPYVRVTGNLSLTITDLSAKIPPYNPQKLLTDCVGGDDQTPPAAEPDAEVSFVDCDLVAADQPRTKSRRPAVCDLNSLLPKVKAVDAIAARRCAGARARRRRQRHPARRRACWSMPTARRT